MAKSLSYPVIHCASLPVLILGHRDVHLNAQIFLLLLFCFVFCLFVYLFFIFVRGMTQTVSALTFTESALLEDVRIAADKKGEGGGRLWGEG